MYIVSSCNKPPSRHLRPARAWKELAQRKADGDRDITIERTSMGRYGVIYERIAIEAAQD